jgi:hypothetical protein
VNFHGAVAAIADPALEMEILGLMSCEIPVADSLNQSRDAIGSTFLLDVLLPSLAGRRSRITGWPGRGLLVSGIEA